MNGLAQDRELVKALVEYSGLSPSAVAKKAGVAVTTINRPFSGVATTRLSQRTLEKLRDAYPNFPGWDGVAFADTHDEYRTVASASSRRDDEVVEISQIDLRFGLGTIFMDEEVTDQYGEKLPFPRQWLRTITNSRPEDLYWARGQGDSMEPKISDGDVILIDRSQTTPGFGDLCWAIAYGQTGMIKRLRPMADGSVKILSDNQSVPVEIAYDGELHVFGRVIGVWKRI